MSGQYVEQKGTSGLPFSSSGARAYSPLRQFLFLSIGSMLSLVVFLSLQFVVREHLKNRNQQTLVKTARDFDRRIDALENTMGVISLIISASPEALPVSTAAKIKGLKQDFSHFQQLLWLYQPSPQRWKILRLHEGADASDSGPYRFKVDQRGIAYLVGGGVFSDDRLKVVTDLPGMRLIREGGTESVTSRPLALVKVLEKENLKTGVLVALTTSRRIFGPKPLEEPELIPSPRISSMRVLDVQAGKNIYALEQGGRKKNEAPSFSGTYNVGIGDSQWRVELDFTDEKYARVLESTPYAFFALFLALTFLGTFYMRSSHNRLLRIARMSEELEEKRRSLEGEVAERARLNRALGKAEKENRAIIDSVSDIIFETDAEGEILFLNATWKKVTGFDPEQSVGSNLFQVISPEDQEQQKKDFYALAKGLKEAYRSFTRLRTSDGSFRAVELAVSMTRQDDGGLVRVVGTFTDVEERRRAERALAEAEKKYRTIVENAAGGIYQLTPEGLYLSANPAMARILGYNGPEEILRAIKNANCEVYADREMRKKIVRDLEKEGSLNNVESPVYRKDGTQIWVNENMRVVRGEQGSILYYEGSMEDITSRHEANRALREAKMHSDLANRAKSEFLANMSHELRTPLNAIIGFSDMIKNEVFGPVEQKAYAEYAKDINESGRNLLNVINEILDISKIEAGERQLNESMIDVAAVLESCLELLKAKIMSNKMIVTKSLEGTPALLGEEVAIKQILINLLSNAIKFTPSGGRITISSEVDSEGRLHLSITDTGVGLDEAEIEKALSPFGQIDTELDRSGSGTGLGLTLVDALLKLHGGELEMLSQKGIGTTVTLIFPAERVHVREEKRTAPASQ